MDETIQTIDPHRAIAYIVEKAEEYSVAKGSRIESEHLLKTVKAILMNEESGSVALKEAYALSHDTYIQKIEEIKKYTIQEEYLKMMLDAAKARIEVWKVQEYSKRAEMKAGL
jgi:uncharacterized membrane-anchored protein YjiN (DUF445 family)